MIIKSIRLSNIRSYVEEEIRLDEGITLFEGDIGSGKTTILMAIDFALFGNSTRDFYARLLRKGVSKGYVEIVFEHNGVEYTIHRALERNGERISNNESYVVGPEGKMNLTATQVRNYVLELMGVHIDVGSKGRRRSLPLVKYAIYTPQEMMKEILEGDDEERLDVIRKIFKLDEYNRAGENAAEVARVLSSDGKVSSVKEEEISRVENELNMRVEEMEKAGTELSSYREQLASATEELKISENDWVAIQGLRKRYESLRVEIGVLEANLRTTRENLSREVEEMERIKKNKARLEEIEPHALRFEDVLRRKKDLEHRYRALRDMEVRYRAAVERIKMLEKKVSELESLNSKLETLMSRRKELEGQVLELGDLESRLEELEEKRSSVRGEIQALNTRLEELEKETEEIRLMGGVCPKCKRPLTEEHKKKLIEENISRKNKLRDNLVYLARKEAEIKKLIGSTKERIERIRGIQKELAALDENINSLRSDIEERERAKEELENERARLPSFSGDELKSIYSELERVSREEESLRKLWEEYTSLKKLVESEGRIKKNIEEYSLAIERLSKEIEEKRKEISTLGYSEDRYREIERRYRAAVERVSSLRSKIHERESYILSLKKDIESKRDLIARLREEVKILKRRGEFGEWLKNDFVEALKDIENMRLLAINEEFRSLFEEWFYELLGESDYEPWIDEKFRPIIRYQRFDMPLSTLSGGERTSVALAYRLALNTMVKKSLGLRSNLLILDEPTDGFSKDQLYKLKDVFEKMETDQIIIVSHEKELMNLADQVYHVEKVNGVSRIRII